MECMSTFTFICVEVWALAIAKIKENPEFLLESDVRLDVLTSGALTRGCPLNCGPPSAGIPRHVNRLAEPPPDLHNYFSRLKRLKWTVP